jgi:moderate conductance mechanosensitive channel
MPTTLQDLSEWLLTKGLHIVLVVLFAVITTRLIRWIAGRISKRLASVISSVAIAVLYTSQS